MSASIPPPLTSSRYGPYSAYIAAEHANAELALDAWERLGGPVPRRRARYGRKLLGLAIGAGGIWLAVNHREEVAAWSARIADGLYVFAQSSQTPAQSAPRDLSVPPRADAAAPLPEVDVPPVRSALATEKPPAPAEEATPPSDNVEKLPPVAADPEDPLQKRALAIGLHPGLSRALLKRLTAADFRNAEHAIRTALSQAVTSEVFVWPRQRPDGVALFKVKFVAGAPPECRRYVVMVLKDGWETTAMPMERCGEAKAAHRG